MTTLLLGLIAVAGNLLGGVVVYRLEDPNRAGNVSGSSRRSLHVLLNIGAGFLLAVTILEMIPAALQTIRPQVLSAPIILGGYLFIYLVENTVSPHIHVLPDGKSDVSHGDHHEHAASALSPPAFYAVLVGLTIHSFFDGVAIGSGAELSRSLGWLLMFAIVLHKVPEGATVASLAILAGLGRRAAIIVPLVLGAATLVGLLFVSLLSTRFVGIALGLAAGVTLYIAASDLVPHARAARTARLDLLLLFAGVGLFALTDYLLRLLGLR